MGSWFKRIAQRYPGGDFLNMDTMRNKPRYDFDTDKKFDYWGMARSGNPDYHDEFARNSNLTRIQPQHVKQVVEHLAEKYYPIVEHVVQKSIHLCENNRYLDINYDKDEEPEIDQAFADLRKNVKETAASMIQRAEITDREFMPQLVGFIDDNVQHRLADMAKSGLQDKPLFVRVYGSSKAYGGPEEGGWNYTSNAMVHEEQIQGIQAACQRRAQLEKDYEDKGKDSFYEDLENLHGGARDLYDEESSAAGGMGDLSYDERDSEGMSYPIGWTPSAFEMFFVQVEVTDAPNSETGAPPHYE